MEEIELTRPERVAIYCRVPTQEQKEAHMIETQVEFAERDCELHGHQVVALCRDDAVSGTVPLAERHEGRRLVTDARQDKLDVPLVHRIDRLARSTSHFLRICEMLDANVR